MLIRGSYQNGDTPSNRIPMFGVVSSVPLEYMHLVCLGVVRKLLLFWCDKPLQFNLSLAHRKIISDNLITFRQFSPDELARVPRSLNTVNIGKQQSIVSFFTLEPLS